jgi:hypothetical protein
MPKRSSKPLDINQLAAAIVAEATAEGAPKAEPLEQQPPVSEKNPAAVALGRLGGKKGGPARAQKLTAEERSEIASKAAITRWSRNPK